MEWEPSPTYTNDGFGSCVVVQQEPGWGLWWAEKDPHAPAGAPWFDHLMVDEDGRPIYHFHGDPAPGEVQRARERSSLPPPRGSPCHARAALSLVVAAADFNFYLVAE